MGYDFHLILRTLAVPPAPLLLLLGLGLVLLAVRRRRPGVWAIVLATVPLLALAMPVVAGWLASGLIAHAPLARPLAADRCQAIVVPGGGLAIAAPEWGGDTVSGSTLARLRYAIALARESGLPIALSGGSPVPSTISEAEAMRRVAEDEFAQPVAWVEERSRNTWENAERTYALLAPEGIRRVCLVTHADHMARAEQAFIRAGFAVVPAPIGLPAATPPRVLDYIPTGSGLGASERAMQEWLGRAWYWIRDQLAPANDTAAPATDGGSQRT